jgi:hypothetical protein
VVHATKPSPSGVDIADARNRLAHYAERNAELFKSLDPGLQVRKSEWTVGETAAHLIFALRGFTDSAIGNPDEWFQWADQIPQARTPERIVAVNRALIPAEPRRDRASAAQAVVEGAHRFLTATASLSPTQPVPTPWYGDGESLTVAEATCLLLGEQVVHGYDLARSFRRRWPITNEDALLIFEAGRQMMPKIADPVAIGRTAAVYELRLGRGSRFVVRVADGSVAVEPSAGQRIHCHVSADPVALMLLAYGRTGQWRPISRGKMMTWGRKPWLAFRFSSFFSNP